MGIRVTWGNAERTFINFNFEGDWTWDELERATDQATGMLDSIDYTVDFIMDIRHANQVPKDLMSHAERIASGHHPRRGIMVVVGANRLLRTVGRGLRKLFPEATRNVLFAADLEEAHELIVERQMSRP
jgi:hypothetical protein